MKSQVFFGTLALAIFCAIPTTTGQSTTTSYVETTTIKSSNSSSTSANSTFEDAQQPDAEPVESAYYSQMPNSWSMDPDSPQSNGHRRYYDEAGNMEPTNKHRNSTHLPDEAPFDKPSQPLECPGPADPSTGEAVLDSNLDCAIVCYNNLVLNEDGDACVCPSTFQYDPDLIKCVCRSPFVQRGSKCVLMPSQAPGARHGSHKKRSINQQLPLDFGLLHGKYRRSEVDYRNCPDQEIACPMQSGGYECLDPEVTLDSCGGCASSGTGVDCRNITGADAVGCQQGSCVIFGCQKGFKLVDGGCVPKHHRRS